MLAYINTEGELTFLFEPDYGGTTYIELREGENLGGEYTFYNGYISLPSYGGPKQMFYSVNGNPPILSSYGWQVTEGVLISGNPVLWSGEQSYHSVSSGKEIAISAPSGSIGGTEPVYDLRPARGQRDERLGLSSGHRHHRGGSGAQLPAEPVCQQHHP